MEGRFVEIRDGCEFRGVLGERRTAVLLQGTGGTFCRDSRWLWPPGRQPDRMLGHVALTGRRRNRCSALTRPTTKTRRWTSPPNMPTTPTQSAAHPAAGASTRVRRSSLFPNLLWEAPPSTRQSDPSNRVVNHAHPNSFPSDPSITTFVILLAVVLTLDLPDTASIGPEGGTIEIAGATKIGGHHVASSAASTSSGKGAV